MHEFPPISLGCTSPQGCDSSSTQGRSFTNCHTFRWDLQGCQGWPLHPRFARWICPPYEPINKHLTVIFYNPTKMGRYIPKPCAPFTKNGHVREFQGIILGHTQTPPPKWKSAGKKTQIASFEGGLDRHECWRDWNMEPAIDAGYKTYIYMYIYIYMKHICTPCIQLSAYIDIIYIYIWIYIYVYSTLNVLFILLKKLWQLWCGLSKYVPWLKIDFTRLKGSSEVSLLSPTRILVASEPTPQKKCLNLQHKQYKTWVTSTTKSHKHPWGALNA